MGNVISTRYEYTRISEPDTIRLLHLHPGKDDIEIDLHQVSLAHNVEYEAISYCWGDPTLVEPVYCQGRVLNVPRTLHAALKQLRLPDRDRVLWADSICINQRDDVEKGQQVSMMNLIYSRPNRVLIWLGAEMGDVAGVGESIRQVSALLPDETFDAEELSRKSREFYAGLNDARRAGRPHYHCHDWTPINNLLCRPWFQRKWIIQEVIMAPDEVPRLLICGDIEIPWEDLASLGYKMASYGLNNSATAMSCLYGYRPSCLTFLQNQAQPVQSLFNAMMIKIASHFRHDPKLSLRDMVGATGGFKCTDQRDHLYALLSMTTNPASIQPIYSKDFGPAEMCMQFAQATLVTQRDLKTLALAPHRSLPGIIPGFQRLPDLPSWVPDLTVPCLVDCITSYDIRTNLFSAGGDGNPGTDPGITIRTSQDGKLLHLRGRIIDSIQAKNDSIFCFAPLPSEQDVLPKKSFTDRVRMRARDWFRGCMDVAYGDCDDSSTPGQGEAVWRTADEQRRRTFALAVLCEVVGMRDRVTEGVVEATIDYIDYLLDYFEPGFVFNDYPEKRARVLEYGGMIEGSMAAIVGGRKFCRTAEGKRFCVARSEVEVGDLVCVVTGAEVPYVIREVTSSSRDGEEEEEEEEEEKDGKEKRYVLIGDCYVSGGVMYGEAMKGGRYEEVEIVLE